MNVPESRTFFNWRECGIIPAGSRPAKILKVSPACGTPTILPVTKQIINLKN